MGKDSKQSRKELLREFRETREVGGVYAVKNDQTGKRLLLSTMTIAKAQNQLDFAKLTGSCVHPPLADDWRERGAAAFSLEILETLERKETQSEAEFRDDIIALEALWRERLAGNDFY
jgi:hypothetical protein